MLHSKQQLRGLCRDIRKLRKNKSSLVRVIVLERRAQINLNRQCQHSNHKLHSSKSKELDSNSQLRREGQSQLTNTIRVKKGLRVDHKVGPESSLGSIFRMLIILKRHRELKTPLMLYNSNHKHTTQQLSNNLLRMRPNLAGSHQNNSSSKPHPLPTTNSPNTHHPNPLPILPAPVLSQPPVPSPNPAGTSCSPRETSTVACTTRVATSTNLNKSITTRLSLAISPTANSI